MSIGEIKKNIEIVKSQISITWISETKALEEGFSCLEELENQLSAAILKGSAVK